jgi:hypothetical protein
MWDFEKGDINIIILLASTEHPHEEISHSFNNNTTKAFHSTLRNNPQLPSD